MRCRFRQQPKFIILSIRKWFWWNHPKLNWDFADESVADILNLLPYPFNRGFKGGTAIHVFLNRPFLEEIGYTLWWNPNHWRLVPILTDIDYRLSIQSSWNNWYETPMTKVKSTVTHARIHRKMVTNGLKSSLVAATGYQFVSFINIDDVPKQKWWWIVKKSQSEQNKMLSILSHDLRSAWSLLLIRDNWFNLIVSMIDFTWSLWRWSYQTELWYTTVMDKSTPEHSIH